MKLRAEALAPLAVMLGLAPSPSAAQLTTPAPPRITAHDEIGVDLQSRSTSFSLTDLSIGSGQGALVHKFSISGSRTGGAYTLDNFIGGKGTGGSACGLMVGIGSVGDCFLLTGGVYVPYRNNGSTLVSNGGGIFTYTTKDGTEYTIDSSIVTYRFLQTNAGVVTKIKAPNGLITTISWLSLPAHSEARIQSVNRSDGLQFKYSYASDVWGTASAVATTTAGDWARLTKITAINNAVEYCDPNANSCALSGTWKSVTYNWSSLGTSAGYLLSVVDQASQVTNYTTDQVERVVLVKPATSSTDQYKYIYCRNGAVQPVSYPYAESCFVQYSDGSGFAVSDGIKYAFKEGRQYNYAPVLTIGGCGCYYANKSIDPDGRQISYSSFSNAGEPRATSFTAKDGTFVTYNQDQTNAIAAVAPPGQAKTTYLYDGRGNVIEMRQLLNATPGAGDLVTSASFPASCANTKTCNQPTTITDPNLNSWSYTYDSAHGGVLTAAGPMVGGISPQVRTTYVQRYAWTKNASGAFVRSTDPVWLVASEASCRTTNASGAGCSGGANDEVVTTYDYGPDSAPNNLFLRGKVVTADGVTLRTCFGYDQFGNKISETQPAANLATCS